MNRSMLTALAVSSLVLLVATGCSGGPPGTPDAEIGLSKASVFDTPTPDVVAENTLEIGEASPIPRAHPEAPPVIPHGVADLLPITRDENLCLDCHMVEERTEGGPIPIPKSHYVDLRNAPSEHRETVVGARYVCVTCHAETREAAPLVMNRFGR